MPVLRQSAGKQIGSGAGALVPKLSDPVELGRENDEVVLQRQHAHGTPSARIHVALTSLERGAYVMSQTCCIFAALAGRGATALIGVFHSVSPKSRDRPLTYEQA